MELKYKLNKEDYIEFNLLTIVNSEAVQKFYLLQKMLVAITFALVLYFFKKETEISTLNWIIFYLVILSLWTILEIFLLKLILKKKLIRDIKNNPEIIGEKNLSLMKDGLYDISGGSKIRNRWDTIKFIDKGEDYIYIFTTMNNGYIIPRKNIFKNINVDKFLKELEKRTYDNQKE